MYGRDEAGDTKTFYLISFDKSSGTDPLPKKGKAQERRKQPGSTVAPPG
jgi:hypothetical protein